MKAPQSAILSCGAVFGRDRLTTEEEELFVLCMKKGCHFELKLGM